MYFSKFYGKVCVIAWLHFHIFSFIEFMKKLKKKNSFQIVTVEITIIMRPCHNHKVSLLNLFLFNQFTWFVWPKSSSSHNVHKNYDTYYFMYTRSFFFCIYHAKFCHITQKKEAIAIYRNFGIGSLAQGLYGHNHLLIWW